MAFRIKGMMETMNEMFRTEDKNKEERIRLKAGEVVVIGNCNTFDAYQEKCGRAITIAGYTLPRQSLKEK